MEVRKLDDLCELGLEDAFREEFLDEFRAVDLAAVLFELVEEDLHQEMECGHLDSAGVEDIVEDVLLKTREQRSGRSKIILA
jgi:hypothetical protein